MSQINVNSEGGPGADGLQYERREVVTPTAQEVETVVADPYAQRQASLFKFRQTLYLILGIIEALLVIRFVLRLLAANPGAAFVSLMYAITGPLVAPFVGIFGTVQSNGSVLEPHTIVGMIVYWLLAWLIIRVVSLALARTRSGLTTSRSVRTRVQ